MSLILNIMLSTLNSGIENVKNVILPERDDVIYLISHQFTEERFKYIPLELKRNDIRILQIAGKGVAKSRNNVIRLANGDIGLFSDDDVSYTYEYIDTVIETFREKPDLDLALFKINTPDGFPEYKKYPETNFKLKKLPFSVGTIEIAIKINSIRKSGVLFDERFGAGQPLLIGSDESIFVNDCIKRGLNCWFFPHYVVNHPYESTIKHISRYDRRRISVAGAVDARILGWKAIPKAIAATIVKTPDLLRNNKKPIEYLKERLKGVMFILFKKEIK